MRASWLAVVASLSLAAAACGGGGSDSSETPGPTPSPTPAPGGSPTPGAATLTIQGSAFSPLSLQVSPGTVVTVRNLDSMAHTVTSQATPSAFTPGAVAGVSFDTGAFVGTRTFTIPSTAPVGTTVPYYCSTHGSTMVTPNGEIRIASASGAVETPQGTPSDPGSPTY